MICLLIYQKINKPPTLCEFLLIFPIWNRGIIHSLLCTQRKFICTRERAKQAYLYFIHNSPICNTRYFSIKKLHLLKHHSLHKRHSKPNIRAFLKHTHFASHLTNFMSYKDQSLDLQFTYLNCIQNQKPITKTRINISHKKMFYTTK
jgi:hypothetical protein